MTQSDAVEMAALRARFPKPAPGAAAFQALSIVATTGYLAYLVHVGESSPVAIAAFGVLELIGHSLIANVAMLSVPKASRVGVPDMPLPKRLAGMAVLIGWLVGVGWLGVGGDAQHVAVVHRAHDPLAALEELNVLRPLALALLLAAVSVIADRVRWSVHRGPFVNGLAMGGVAKFLTAAIAPMLAFILVNWDAWSQTRAVATWCAIYLGMRCVLELLLLWWQFLGMPEREDNARSGKV